MRPVTKVFNKEVIMKYKQKIGIILIILFLPLMAEEVMKITLTTNVSVENLSNLGTIIFKENTIVAGSSYNIDEILKIEFYNDATSIVGGANNPQIAYSSLKPNQICFKVTASTLSFTLPKTSKLSVSLYSSNGRKVSELFSGDAEKGLLQLNINKSSLASGIYMVMAKVENTLFVRKLIIK